MRQWCHDRHSPAPETTKAAARELLELAASPAGGGEDLQTLKELRDARLDDKVP